jgi:aryl-alcohol dehydrogenase-like predicted oxidoreductase
MPDLPTAPLGTTGMDVTRVGLGAWAIGGGGWFGSIGHQDDGSSRAAIRHAVERGVNWIDTAAVYGHGHSEEVVAAALHDLPEADRPYVFTKGGLAWDEQDRSREPQRVGAPASLRREVEASLRRLRVERLDLYQMHWPAADGTPLEDYWQVFLDLRSQGKVRAVGLSNHDVADLDACEKLGHVDSLQPLLNAVHREAAGDVVPWCADHGTGVIVYSPMASGLLSGGFTAERAERFDALDLRRRSADFQGAELERNLALADALRPIARRHDVTVAAVAVAWTLAFPGVTGAIVGARRPDQIDGWLPAARLSLTPADLDEIAEGIGATNAGTGPARPPHGA